MKIAILTEILSTHSGSRAPIELAKNLSLSNEVTLVCFSLFAEKTLKEELKKRDIKLILIDIPKIPFGKWLAAFKFLPYLRKSEVVSFHGTLPAFLVAKLSGKPLVQTYYGTQLDAYWEKLLPYQVPDFKDKILNWLGNQIILFINKIYLGWSNQSVAISRYAADEAASLYGRKIPFIHLGANSLVTNHQPLVTNHQSPTTISILSVSRLTPYKGFHLLIETAKKIGKKVNLYLVGSAPRPKYLEYLEKIKTPETKILIDISDSRLANLYQNCDLYVSADRYLFFGLPPLEAALSGKPSIVLDYCAAREIINHQKTGYVAKNLNEFEKYLKILIDNPELRKRLGIEAKIWAEKNFSWQKTALEYQKLFKIAVKN